jgi:hypothetical protein
MPLLIFCALGSILVYFMASFFLSYYSKSDDLAIKKASGVLSGGFALFVLSVYCESIVPGKAGQWTEVCLMIVIGTVTCVMAFRILHESRKCPK